MVVAGYISRSHNFHVCTYYYQTKSSNMRYITIVRYVMLHISVAKCQRIWYITIFYLCKIARIYLLQIETEAENNIANSIILGWNFGHNGYPYVCTHHHLLYLLCAQ